MKQNAILYEKILDSEKALDHAKKQVVCQCHIVSSVIQNTKIFPYRIIV